MMNWTWQRRGHVKKDTKLLLLDARNNAIRTNYVNSGIRQVRIASVSYADKEMK